MTDVPRSPIGSASRWLMILAVGLLLPTAVVVASEADVLEARAEILAELETRGERLDGLTLEMEGKSGEDYLVILGQIGALEEEMLELFDALVENAEAASELGLDNSELDTVFEINLIAAVPYLIDLIEESENGIQQLGQQREQTPAAELPGIVLSCALLMN